MTMSINIEKNIPMPKRAPVARRRVEKYPELRQLKVGDSFMVPIADTTLRMHTRRVTKETGCKFVVRSVVNDAGDVIGSRVWRKS
jgi:hypothetical protein